MSRPKGTPDYLMATSNTGHLMGSTCDWPEGYGATWHALMERQGGTVTRMTLDEYRAWRLGKTAPAASELLQDENAPETVEIPTDVKAPALGEELLHPLLGRATVTSHLQLDGHLIAVASGPRGAGLVREWTSLPAVPVTPEPEPVPEVPAIPVPPGAWFMPSLFDFGASQ